MYFEYIVALRSSIMLFEIKNTVEDILVSGVISFHNIT
jgi:hypothetical protein